MGFWDSLDARIRSMGERSVERKKAQAAAHSGECERGVHADEPSSMYGVVNGIQYVRVSCKYCGRVEWRSSAGPTSGVIADQLEDEYLRHRRQP